MADLPALSWNRFISVLWRIKEGVEIVSDNRIYNSADGITVTVCFGRFKQRRRTVTYTTWLIQSINTWTVLCHINNHVTSISSNNNSFLSTFPSQYYSVMVVISPHWHLTVQDWLADWVYINVYKMFHVSLSAVLAGLETTDGRNTFYWILPGHPGILRVKDEEQISSDNGRHCLFLWRGHFEVECIWQICLLWMHILPLLSEYTYKHPRIQCRVTVFMC